MLLKALPCKWGKCSFCNYIEDNSTDIDMINQLNGEVLKSVTGKLGALEVINSGSCFELPPETLQMLQVLVKEKKIKKLYFETHWLYRKRLHEFKQMFEIPIVFITGIETFDETFRNKVLRKGVNFENVAEIKKYFSSVCLMVGMLGQTREMIENDVKILLENFDHGTINLFVDNNTEIKPDYELQEWFRQQFSWLEKIKKIDILWKNTDFEVGTVIDE